jgi:hypothetical protein
MIYPAPIDLTITQAISASDLALFARSSNRALAAHRASNLRQMWATMQYATRRYIPFMPSIIAASTLPVLVSTFV